jgi:hypothetical protein
MTLRTGTFWVGLLEFFKSLPSLPVHVYGGCS